MCVLSFCAFKTCLQFSHCTLYSSPDAMAAFERWYMVTVVQTTSSPQSAHPAAYLRCDFLAVTSLL
jgi:hypothetical protein